MRARRTRRQKVAGLRSQLTVTRDPPSAAGSTTQRQIAYDGLPSSVHDRYAKTCAVGSYSCTFERLGQRLPTAFISTTHSAPGVMASGRSRTFVICPFQSGRRSMSLRNVNTSFGDRGILAVTLPVPPMAFSSHLGLRARNE